MEVYINNCVVITLAFASIAWIWLTASRHRLPYIIVWSLCIVVYIAALWHWHRPWVWISKPTLIRSLWAIQPLWQTCPCAIMAPYPELLNWWLVSTVCKAEGRSRWSDWYWFNSVILEITFPSLMLKERQIALVKLKEYFTPISSFAHFYSS